MQRMNIIILVQVESVSELLRSADTSQASTAPCCQGRELQPRGRLGTINTATAHKKPRRAKDVNDTGGRESVRKRSCCGENRRHLPVSSVNTDR